jgi:hypothetical protein
VASQQPPAGGGKKGQTHDNDDEVDDRYVSERVQVASVPGDEGEVGTPGAVQGSEQGESARRRARDGAARRAAGPRGGESSQVVGAFTADQADGHGQHAESKEKAGGDGPVAKCRRRLLCRSGLDGQPGGRRQPPRGVDLGRGEWVRRLDEPAVWEHLQSEGLDGMSRDERVGVRGVGGQLDRLDRRFGSAAGPAAE